MQCLQGTQCLVNTMRRNRCHQALNLVQTYSAAYLINEILAVVVTQLLRPDDTMEVRFHELLNKVYLSELIEAGRLEDVKDRNDVLVTEMTKEFYFA
jgi:hypothetical protein